jgi:hypothetical protein
MFGWIFRRRATASATALFGPWPYSSLVRRSLRPLPHCHRSGLRLQMGALVIFVHNRRGSSSPPSGRHGRSLKTVLDLPHLLCLGMGRAQSDIAFSPQLRFRPGGGCAGVGPAQWRRRRGEWSQLPKAEVVLAVSLVLYGGGIFLSLYTT